MPEQGLPRICFQPHAAYQVYRLRSAPGRKVMLKFLLELLVQLHYIAKQGYYIFSRATKILKLVALLATNDLP